MIDVYSTYEGELPLLISVPHDGCHLPIDMRERMTTAGLALPDTDWHVAELYGFARDIGASLLVANYSRYVVDLNRSATDDDLYPGQMITGLCPLKTFSGDDIYADGGVDDQGRSERITRYWQPYHARLEAILESMRAQFGYALLWDAHSIPSVVPRLFDGELPELNIGTNSGRSCAISIEAAVLAEARAGDYSTVANERFKGGYITRHYGDPNNSIHALQLEIAQRTYMNEQTTVYNADKAQRLQETLRRLLRVFVDAAN